MQAQWNPGRRTFGRMTVPWQPIATAPRDLNRPILLYPRPLTAFPGGDNGAFEGYWCIDDHWKAAASHARAEPTHWLPMPPLPPEHNMDLLER